MQYFMESEAGTKAIINKKLVDYFSGCGYFCLQTHPEVVQAACESTQKYGISSATSASIYGNNPVLIDFQEKAAKFFNVPNVLYYVSGCFGTSILLEGLKDDYDIIFFDSESHYSSLLATSMVNKTIVVFNHRSAEDLKQKIDENLKPRQRPMVVCDGIFPISGEVSPLHHYIEIMNEIDGSIFCVDDAHATGVIGENGYGTYDYFGMKGNNLYSSGTLSKALGGHGGIIYGDMELMTKLKHKSSLANACSTIPIPAAAATAKAFDILHHHPELRMQLWDNVKYVKSELSRLGFEMNNTPVPIICIGNQKNFDAQRIQEELFERNIAVTYIGEGGYTSVPKGGAIRIAIFSGHTMEQLERLIYELKSLLR